MNDLMERRANDQFAEVYVRVGPVEARSFMARAHFEQGVRSRAILREMADNTAVTVIAELDAHPERFRQWLDTVLKRSSSAA